MRLLLDDLLSYVLVIGDATCHRHTTCDAHPFTSLPLTAQHKEFA
jgi:hypothetical protein